ncbi:MFS transporter [Herbidospora sp. RD11066]
MFQENRKPALALLCMAQFVLVLDFAIVNVALPSIQQDLGFTDSALQWVVGAYALFFGGFLLVGGRLGDIVGRKRMFVGGLAVFTAASLVGGIATEPIVLIVARALQGLSAAMVSPAVLALIAGGYPEGKERAKAMGIFGAVASAGFTGGVLFGGVLTELFGWRAVMFVNVPVGVALVLRAIRRLDADHVTTRTQKIDIPGAILVTAGMCALTYALTTATDHGWSAPNVVYPLVGAAVLLAAFFVLQTRSANPLVPLSIFKIRGVVAGDSIAFLSGGVMSISTYFLTLYMQHGLGYSAIQTGVAFFPQAVVTILAAKFVADLTGRIGPRPVLIGGAAFLTAGSAWLLTVPVNGSYWLHVLPGGVLIGLGVTVMMISTAVAATTGVDGPRMGLASGLYNSLRQLGVGLLLAIAVTAAVPSTDPQNIGSYHVAFGISTVLSVLIAIIAAAVLPARKAAPVAEQEKVDA